MAPPQKDALNRIAREPVQNWQIVMINRQTHYSQAGNKMGLTVVLDANTNQIDGYSVSTDFAGFTVMVLPPGEFPMSIFNEFHVKPGHNNLVWFCS
jgi:hypothetical protein